MSYLDTPRIHFFGKYFANPSTINNNLSNYDLKPPLILSWNPDGSAFFRFLDCRVSSAVRGDDTVLSGGAGDSIIQATVTTPQTPSTKVGKIVDLDPDQQLITQLFGVVVTLALPGGQGAVTGQMTVAELRDLWFQRVAFSPGADGAASGIWQSVQTDLQWSGLDRSAFLKDLYNKSLGGLELPIGFDTQQFGNANSPPTAISFPKTVTTQPSGQVSIELTASTSRPLPDRRSFIGSQVYFLGGAWESWGQISAESQAAISVLVFNDAPPKDNPIWADVQPVLNQYAVLYPGMTRRLDLSDYQAVSSNSAEILEVISLSIGDPAHMPVTRDLSASHWTLIQTWIKNGCPRGESDV